MAKQKVYAVKVGREGVKIYDTWEECERNVKGFPKSEFQPFETEAEAERWLGLDKVPFAERPKGKQRPLF